MAIIFKSVKTLPVGQWQSKDVILPRHLSMVRRNFGAYQSTATTRKRMHRVKSFLVVKFVYFAKFSRSNSKLARFVLPSFEMVSLPNHPRQSDAFWRQALRLPPVRSPSSSDDVSCSLPTCLGCSSSEKVELVFASGSHDHARARSHFTRHTVHSFPERLLELSPKTDWKKGSKDVDCLNKLLW